MDEQIKKIVLTGKYNTSTWRETIKRNLKDFHILLKKDVTER